MEVVLVRPFFYKPKEGWKPHTWYLIDVAYRNTNPIHRAVLHTGFLDNDEPSSYNFIVAPSYGPVEYGSAHYLKPIRVVATPADFDSMFRLPKDEI